MNVLNAEIPFPLLVPLNNQLNEYKGYINVLGKQYPVEIKLSNSSGNSNNNSNINNNEFKIAPTSTLYIEDLEFNCTKELFDILLPHTHTIKNRFIQCINLQQFFYELKDIIDRISTTATSTTTAAAASTVSKPITLPFDVFSLVLKEIGEYGWNSVINIEKSLSSFEILLYDIKKREFLVEFNISSEYPSVLPTRIRVDLPISNNDLINRLKGIDNGDTAIMIDNNNNNNNEDTLTTTNKYSILNILNKIQTMINIEFQEFFNVMDEIDNNSWVLEPLNPRRSSYYRRIAIGNGCSISFEINPLQPTISPSTINFIGSAHITEPLQQLHRKKHNQWNMRKSPIQNIQSILELKLPLKTTNTSIEEIIIECSICYAHHLTLPTTEDNNNNNNQQQTLLPDITCLNVQCRKQFHYHCIREWLLSVENTTSDISVLRGVCPYCSTKIAIQKKK